MKKQGRSCILKDIHIGEEIKKKIKERGMSYTEFARRIHCERATLYHLFKCKSIDTERLILISEILNYDFIHTLYFPDIESVESLATSGPKLYIAVELPENHPAIESLPEGFIKLIKK